MQMAPSLCCFYQLQEPLSLNQTTDQNKYLKDRQLLVIRRMLPLEVARIRTKLVLARKFHTS